MLHNDFCEKEEYTKECGYTKENSVDVKQVSAFSLVGEDLRPYEKDEFGINLDDLDEFIFKTNKASDDLSYFVLDLQRDNGDSSWESGEYKYPATPTDIKFLETIHKRSEHSLKKALLHMASGFEPVGSDRKETIASHLETLRLACPLEEVEALGQDVALLEKGEISLEQANEKWKIKDHFNYPPYNKEV